MGTLSRSGCPKILSRVSKIIISKTLCKRGKSTRSIARTLVNSVFSASHSTVYRYFRHSIDVYPYKRQRIPRLTNKMMQNRLDFALKHKNWTVTDWEKVLWSDESPFQLFAPPNRQNDQVFQMCRIPGENPSLGDDVPSGTLRTPYNPSETER